MKAITVMAICCMLFTAQSAEGSRGGTLSEAQQQRIAENIVHNLQHPIPEIRENALQLIIDLHLQYPDMDLGFAELPVMRILKSHEEIGMRILAAVALYHIGDRRGRFAVERRALYDDSQRVARHCARIADYWDVKEDAPLQLARHHGAVAEQEAPVFSE